MSNKKYKVNNNNKNYQDNFLKKMSRFNNFPRDQNNKLNTLTNKFVKMTNLKHNFNCRFKIYKIKFYKKNKK